MDQKCIYAGSIGFRAELIGCRSGSVSVNREPWPDAVAGGVDLAAVFFDDAIGDRQAQARALAVAAAGEERLEQMLEHFVGHAAAVVGDDDLGFGPRRRDGDGHFAAGVEAVEALVIRFSTTCFISCGRLRRSPARRRVSSICLLPLRPGGRPSRSRRRPARADRCAAVPDRRSARNRAASR